jgi:acyl carrier protein
MKKARIEIYRALRKMGVKRDEISLDTNIITDLCFDDKELLCFVFLIESRLNIEISNEKIKNINTIGNTINIVIEELQKEEYCCLAV